MGGGGTCGAGFGWVAGAATSGGFAETELAWARVTRFQLGLLTSGVSAVEGPTSSARLAVMRLGWSTRFTARFRATCFAAPVPCLVACSIRAFGFFLAAPLPFPDLFPDGGSPGVPDG